MKASLKVGLKVAPGSSRCNPDTVRRYVTRYLAVDGKVTYRRYDISALNLVCARVNLRFLSFCSCTFPILEGILTRRLIVRNGGRTSIMF